MVDRFAACLSAFGVRQGEAVAILLPNLIPCVAAYYAVMKVGAVAVMNNPLYSDRELEYQFNDSGSKVLITLDLLGNRMIELRPKTNIKQIVYTSIGDYLPFPKNILFPLVAKKKKMAADVKAAPDVYRWKECLAKYAPNPPKVKVDFEDVAMYQYTGGTTGVSKGVMLTHANLSKQVQQIDAWFPKLKKGGVDAGSASLLPCFRPFYGDEPFHPHGLGQRPGASPATGSAPGGDTKYRPTFAPLVPTMYIGMLNHPDVKKTDMTCLKGCFSGSAPLPVEVIRDFEAATGAVIVEGFGLTETTPVTHVNPFAGGARKVGSIGVPISDTLARIVDLETGLKDMPVGEAGELIIKGPQVMKGYLNMPEETAQCAEGRLVLHGRHR